MLQENIFSVFSLWLRNKTEQNKIKNLLHEKSDNVKTYKIPEKHNKPYLS